jgi:segregation and condensation protein B
MNEPQHPQIRLIEALLFASPAPVSYKMLLERIGDEVLLGSLLSILQEDYATRGIHFVEIDGTYSFRTAPDLAPDLQLVTEVKRKLPRVAAETLAIIAYHQPVTRAEIESIRGVATASGTLDILLERGWVRPGKRRETPGRPVTWVTTLEFLSHFNLTALQDLPGLEELKASGMLDARPALDGMAVTETDTTLREHNVTTDTADDMAEPAHWVAEDEALTTDHAPTTLAASGA